MRAWLRLLKARSLLLCSTGVAILGLAPVLYLLGLIAWQIDTRLETGSWVALPAALVFTDRALLQGGDLAPVLAFIPHFPSIPHFDWSWSTNEVAARILSALHVGLIPGLIGCGVMAVGISGALRQRVLIRIHKERKKDSVKRLDNYRRGASRAHAGDDGRREPFIGECDFARNTERRVA
jgi:hypothetical protein